MAPLASGARMWRESKENISPDFPFLPRRYTAVLFLTTKTTVPGGCLANAEAGWLTLHNCKSHMLNG